MIRRESIWRPLQCRVWWTRFYSRLLNCIRDSCITVKTLNKRSTNTSGVSVMTLQCPPTFPEFTHPSPRWDCAMYWAANNDKNLGFLCSRHLAKKPLHVHCMYLTEMWILRMTQDSVKQAKHWFLVLFSSLGPPHWECCIFLISITILCMKKGVILSAVSPSVAVRMTLHQVKHLWHFSMSL